MWRLLNTASTTGPLCLNLFRIRSHAGSFRPTLGPSNDSEQIPHVLKQGSPDMSWVVMTTCNRKDKNNCPSFTESCKYLYVSYRFCSRKAFTQAQTCTKSTVINVQLVVAEDVNHLQQAAQKHFILLNSVSGCVAPSGWSCPAGCVWCRTPPGDSAAWCCQTQQTPTGSGQQSPAAGEHKTVWILTWTS